MIFTWDDEKEQINLRKHRVRFHDAVQIFDQPHVTYFDEKNSDTEDRYVAIGFLGLRLLIVAFTECDGNQIRLISARKATKQEERRYERGY